MSNETREALSHLISALEIHYDVAQRADLGDGTAIAEADERLRDAYIAYDDLLYTTYGVDLPFDTLDDDYDDDDDYEDDYDDDLDIVLLDEDDGITGSSPVQ